MDLPMDLSTVQAAASRIYVPGGCVKTPVHTSSLISAAAGVSAFFKCEHLQRTGSFKFRGAMSAVSEVALLGPETSAKGVVAQSSGNHGAAVSAAAKAFGLPCTVVVPSTTPAAKQDNVTRYGATLVLCEPTQKARVDAAAREAGRMGGAALVHPYNDDPVIAGQGTIGLELMEQVPGLDAILVPVSGGGMITGIALAAKGLDPGVRVIAVEPEGKRLQEALETGRRVVDEGTGGRMLDTICDAIRTQPLGPRAWELNLEKKLLHPEVLSISDDEVRAAMCLTMSELKQSVEPAGAIALAGLLSPAFRELRAREESGGRPIRKVAVVICGGNADLGVVAGHIQKHQEAAGKGS
jgi:serine racemase